MLNKMLDCQVCRSSPFFETKILANLKYACPSLEFENTLWEEEESLFN